MTVTVPVWCKYDRCCSFEQTRANHLYCADHGCSAKAENARRRAQRTIAQQDEETWHLQEQRKLARANLMAQKNEWILANKKIAMFDLETYDLAADFGIIFIGAIKTFRSDEIFTYAMKMGDPITMDQRIVLEIRDKLEEYDYVVTYNGCAVPGSRVLRADLQWVPVETLKPGDKLLAFDEDGPRRKWRESTVLHNDLVLRDVVEVTFDDGTSVQVSDDHPWLLTDGRWQVTDRWQSAPTQRQLPVWDRDTSYEAGWLAGIADGEGCLSDYAGISIAQNEGAVLDRAYDLLKEKGFSPRLDKPTGGRTTAHIGLQGGTAEGLRFLGSFNPTRLMNKFSIEQLGTLKAYPQKPLRPVSIKPLGKKFVCGLGTTTSTYLLEGFGAHNTRFDIPYLNTRLLIHGQRPLAAIRHKDIYFTAKSHLRLQSKRLASVEAALFGEGAKTPILPGYWAKTLQGSKSHHEYIMEHCVIDVQVLERVFETLKGFINMSSTPLKLYGSGYGLAF